MQKHTTTLSTHKAFYRSPLCSAMLVAALCLSTSMPLVAHAQSTPRPDAVTPDGGRYYGALVDGLRQGQGRVEWDSGVRYEGSFANGVFDGKGKLTGPTEEYTGDFKAGRYAGQGELKYQDGRRYKGDFAQGQFHGSGVYSTPDGQVYEGSFEKNIFSGAGTYKRPDGIEHRGQFAKWRPHGVGTYTDAKGNVYEGTFTEGALNGPGRMLGKDGSRYEGEFKNWIYDGQGVFRHANGDEYKGAFADGLFEGEGTLTFAKPQKDGTTHKTGVWRYGTLPNKEAAQKTAANVEAALYNQRTLLDSALAALAPRDPKQDINLYVMAVGGDGSQEVFRREVDFVQQQFDRDFRTQGRSLVLVNSRTTVSQLPMATLTSVREGIQGIASRMDKENDILFLYLSSHGSADHQLTLDQNGMDLRNLGAKELGTLLKESGIRWKVVVVSACYSGGFIEPLQDAHTLVITASRADRRSFGCADENDFTYFGRAFFKESLPTSKSFTEAFQHAKTLVQKWEDDDFKQVSKTEENQHSEPQIATTPAIEEHLRRWRAQR
ncbi:peptidase C13 [Rhodoferax sp. AJA081-3]|uniref:C13 family peptidase n=1 Tax=Rhodoferax sp. AJA081-3 TaxID=2752316 RepID=UPI001AE0B532|nr:C13 family peptidase [Rhodoferax sp. AJA081-3]QTN29099.1 peptidase C13 [Rhodoferax sp. AJA081-3]